MSRAIIRRARRVIRRTISFVTGEAVVLLYHRVCDPGFDPLLLSVSPQNFSDQLSHVRRHYAVLDLRELLAALSRGRLPRRAVAITFDDGYGDNLWSARPLLERHGCPATVFVASGYVGAGREFWWDELERVLFLSPRLPGRLSLTLDGVVHEWDVESAARVPAHERIADRRWTVLRDDDPTPLHRAYRQIHALLSPATAEQQTGAIRELRTQTAEAGHPRPGYLPMTREELRALVEGGTVAVGAHTVTHPLLAAISPESAAREIQRSKSELEDMLTIPVTSFAYPYGHRGAYTERTTAAVRAAGFESAWSNFGGTVRVGADRYQLNRVLVRDWSADEFAPRLRAAFGS